MSAFRPAKRASLILLAVWVPMRFLYWYKGLLFTPAVVLAPLAVDVVKFALDVGDFPI